MISLMNTSVKAGALSCEVPANKLSINILRLLRNQGYIWGFQFVSPKIRSHRLYPRVRILFKYIDRNTPILKGIVIYKISKSNFHILRNNSLYKILLQNKLYLLSTTLGLSITSLDNLYTNKLKSIKGGNSGKILAELFI